MTVTECIEKIEAVTREYIDDEDHWGGYFMEKIIDILREYNREQITQ